MRVSATVTALALAGCESMARVRFDPLAPANLAPTCPGFESAGMDTVSQPLVIASVDDQPDYNPHYDHYPRTLLHITLAESYYPHAKVPDPKARYFLMELAFDLGQSSVGPSPADHSTCGDERRVRLPRGK